MKVLHLQLSEGQHERLSDEAHRNRTSMASLVRGWIDGIGVGKVTTVESKPAVGPIPVKQGVVSEFVCKVCGKPTKGEFLCATCKKL